MYNIRIKIIVFKALRKDITSIIFLKIFKYIRVEEDIKKAVKSY